jgi:arylsulfatase A-like enzyme
VTSDKDGADFLVKAVRAGTATPEDVQQGKALYHAEVASADDAFGALLAGLEERRMLDDAAIVVFGDHGEAFDEEPTRAFGHGFDVDLYAIHVPLVIRGTGRFQIPPRVVDTPVRLQDLATTIAQLAGVGGTLGDGRDLAPLWKGGTIPDVPVFAEATKPKDHPLVLPGWNNLALERAVASGGLLFTRARWNGNEGQLFRLDWDQPPVEDADAAMRLGALLDAWDAKAPPRRDDRIPIATLEALRTLGYVE